MDEPGGHYAKRNKPARKNNTTWYHLCGILKKKKNVERIEAKSRKVVTGVGEWDK